MFYLIVDEKIVQKENTPFEIHEGFTWVEAPEPSQGQVAIYKDGQIIFEQVGSAPVTRDGPKMVTKAARDVVFCWGEMKANSVFTNPNNSDGLYNNFLFCLEGNGEATNSQTKEKIIIDTNNLYNLNKFKNTPIDYVSHENGAKWVAVNPIKGQNVDTVTISGNQTISENLNGITVVNVKGSVIVNDNSLTLNEPVFYHPNTKLEFKVANNSFAVVVKYLKQDTNK